MDVNQYLSTAQSISASDIRYHCAELCNEENVSCTRLISFSEADASVAQTVTALLLMIGQLDSLCQANIAVLFPEHMSFPIPFVIDYAPDDTCNNLRKNVESLLDFLLENRDKFSEPAPSKILFVYTADAQLDTPSISDAYGLLFHVNVSNGRMLARVSTHSELSGSALETLCLIFEKCLRLANSDEYISRIQIFTVDKSKKQQLNKNIIPCQHSEWTIGGLFRDTASRYADNIAVTFSKGHYTYFELNNYVNYICQELLERGISRNDTVIVHAPLSYELVATVLAILKVGATCVPIDFHYPVERKTAIECDTQAKFRIVLKDKQLVLQNADHSILHLEKYDLQSLYAEPQVDVDGEDKAFIFYTSGTTGAPKGVVHNHNRRCNRICWEIDKYGMHSGDVHLLKVAISAGIFAKELLWPLLSGARMVIVDDEDASNVAHIAKLIESERVSILTCVPTMLTMLLTQKAFVTANALRLVISSGETMPTKVARSFLDKHHADLYIAYGMNEMSTVTIAKVMKESTVQSVGVPANVYVYIMNAFHQLLPDGFVGEIGVASDCLAQGYWNDAVKTGERFIANPFSSHISVLYKTGDLGFLKDGQLYISGRVDDQIKIRGYRVEIGDVSSALLSMPGVTDVAVLPMKNKIGGNMIVAYTVADNTVIRDEADIYQFCKRKLPEYMIPKIIMVEYIPRTGAAKIDRAALPEFVYKRQGDDNKQKALTVDLYEIAQIWKKVLDADTILETDTIRALGGDSFQLVRIAALLEAKYNKEIDLVLAWNQTLGEMGRLLR